MSGVYRQVAPDGTVSYTDHPTSSLPFERLRPDGTPEKTQAQRDHETARAVVKKAPTIIPTVENYLAYVSYLRHHSPVRLDRVMRELQVTNPKVWLALQKHPQFRPLADTALGLKAAEKHMAAGIGLATGNVSGSAQKWFETSLKDLMKRDQFGPYSEALTRSAESARTARPADVAAAKAATASGKAMRAAQAGLRAGAATAVTRVGGVGIDVGMQLLNPEAATSLGDSFSHTRIMKLLDQGIFDAEEAAEAQNLLASGRKVELKAMMDAAVQRSGVAR